VVENLYASFVNLDSRGDRLTHMTNQLSKVNLQVERTRGIPWKEVLINHPERANDVTVMLNRTPGAIGCFFSQMSVMEEALKQGKHALVMEDDLHFCSDFDKRMDYIDKWTEAHEWDIIWLGGTFHTPAFWHKIGQSGMPPDCSAQLGKDCEATDDPRMIRTYASFCTYAYIVNIKSIEKVLGLLNSTMHKSIGIDYSMIFLSPNLLTFAFVPGCVKQIDNISDIGTGMTVFSGFARLNGTEENSRYWYQEKMEDFNPETFKWI